MQDVLFQQLINWLTLGCIYSLLALGFSLLFGVLQVIHFSHGDVALVAPFVALAAVQILATSLERMFDYIMNIGELTINLSHATKQAEKG